MGQFKEVTYDEFILDYNEYYQENVRILRTNTMDLPEIFFNLYDSDDYEIDDDAETIRIYS